MNRDTCNIFEEYREIAPGVWRDVEDIAPQPANSPSGWVGKGVYAFDLKLRGDVTFKNREISFNRNAYLAKNRPNNLAWPVQQSDIITRMHGLEDIAGSRGREIFIKIQPLTNYMSLWETTYKRIELNKPVSQILCFVWDCDLKVADVYTARDMYNDLVSSSPSYPPLAINNIYDFGDSQRVITPREFINLL